PPPSPPSPPPAHASAHLSRLFLPRPRPPRPSTLFPYTTLFRSRPRTGRVRGRADHRGRRRRAALHARHERGDAASGGVLKEVLSNQFSAVSKGAEVRSQESEVRSQNQKAVLHF